MQSKSSVFATLTFEEILDDLSSRFIINVPEVELASIERICFQVEQAHWFYEDFIRESRPGLPSFHLKTFSARIFKQCPLLHQWADTHERVYADFMQYRIRIPVCGAIILNPNFDKCVLVKGWTSKSGWGFPKGKINQEEDYDECAIREVLEETGFDISPLLKENDFISLTLREQYIRLYIIQGVSEETQFATQTRKEISQISWVKLDELPLYKQTDPTCKSSPYRFYLIAPFMQKLKIFINQRKKASRKSNKSSHSKRDSKPAAVNESSNATFQSPPLGVEKNHATLKLKSSYSSHTHSVVEELSIQQQKPTNSAVRRNSLLSLLKSGLAQVSTENQTQPHVSK